MRNLRNFLVVLGGVVGSATAGALTAVGCSSSSTQVSPGDGGMDGSTDAHPDISVDVLPEAQPDSQGDVVDAGAADVDSGASIPPFLTQLATTYCEKVAECCTSQLPDGSTFNTASCISVNTIVGYQGTAIGASSLLSAGVLSYDPNKAAACLSDINAIDCTGNVITTQQQISILTDCTDAVYGTFDAGASCTSSIECASGMYCNTPDDAGVVTGPGKCVPLSGDGGPCGNFGDIPTAACQSGPDGVCDFGLSEEACSYRRTGTSGLACLNSDLSNGDTLQPLSSWVCHPAGATTADCNLNQDCVTQLCDPGPPGYEYVAPDGSVTPGGTLFQCASSIPFAYLNACLAYAH